MFGKKETKVYLTAGTIVWDNVFNAVVITDEEYKTLKANGVEYLKVDQAGNVVGFEYKSK